ncbi:MAG: hypothetical protein NC191_05110 [Muribaculaceae bacterium]|nr:hypothetical protein [Muribaculaceae bacterium]
MKNAKDYKTFNAAYYEIFKQNFDPKQAQAVKQLTEKYSTAVAYDLSLKNIEIAKSSAQPDGINGIEGCYSRASYNLGLEGNQLELLVRAYAHSKGTKFEKHEYKLLQEFLNVCTAKTKKEQSEFLLRNNVSSTTELGNKLKGVEATLYNGRQEFVTDIEEFNKGVKEGGAYVEIGVEIALTIALSAVGGTVLSSFSGLSKAEKFVKLAQLVNTVGSSVGADIIIQKTTTGTVDTNRTLKNAIYTFIGAKTSKLAEAIGAQTASKISNKFLSKCTQKGVTEIGEDSCDILSSLIIECGGYSSDDAVNDAVMNFAISRLSGGSGLRTTKKAYENGQKILNRFKQAKNNGLLKNKKDYIAFFNNNCKISDSTPDKAQQTVSTTAIEPSVTTSNFTEQQGIKNNQTNTPGTTDSVTQVIGVLGIPEAPKRSPDEVITTQSVNDDSGREIRRISTDTQGQEIQRVEYEYDINGNITKAVAKTRKTDTTTSKNQNGETFEIVEITYSKDGYPTNKVLRTEYVAEQNSTPAANNSIPNFEQQKNILKSSNSAMETIDDNGNKMKLY